MSRSTNHRRPGRRAGDGDTRAAILAAARTLFAERGLAGATIRAIAEEAGVDSALIHHYFGTKKELYIAAADLAVDPEVIRAKLRTAPFEALGHTLATAVLTLWDSPESAALQARFRTAVGADHGEEIRDFLLSAAHPILSERLQEGSGSGRSRPITVASGDIDRRIALAVTQLLGTVVARRVLRFPEIVQMSIDELVGAIGPVIQAHLAGTTLQK